jgi:putative hydrolase of the HAD superfamily
MIKAVFFDLDGTLYDRDALVQELVADQHASFEPELLGLPRERFIAEVLEMDDHGYGDKVLGYERLVAEWRLASDLADRLCVHFWTHYDQHCYLPLDAVQTLRTLRAHGKQLGVITNGGTERQRCKLVALGLEDAFDVVLISEAEGVRKPAAEIFHRALRRCGVAASEAAFVGDHPETDVEGARNAGLLPFWKHVSYWRLRTENVATVHRLTEILPICLVE